MDMLVLAIELIAFFLLASTLPAAPNRRFFR